MTRRGSELDPFRRGFVWKLLGALWRQDLEPSTAGSGYLALGGLMTLGALGALLVSRFAPLPREQHLPPAFQAVRVLTENFGWLATLQVPLAIIVVLSSLAFRRGRRWARLVLDAVTLSFAGWTVWFGVFWERTVWAMTVARNAGGIRLFGLAMMAAGAFVVGLLVVLAVLAVRYLHGSRVEAHLSEHPGPRTRP